jgi:hypothetical protein
MRLSWGAASCQSSPIPFPLHVWLVICGAFAVTAFQPVAFATPWPLLRSECNIAGHLLPGAGAYLLIVLSLQLCNLLRSGTVVFCLPFLSLFKVSTPVAFSLANLYHSKASQLCANNELHISYSSAQQHKLLLLRT